MVESSYIGRIMRRRPKVGTAIATAAIVFSKSVCSLHAQPTPNHDHDDDGREANRHRPLKRIRQRAEYEVADEHTLHTHGDGYVADSATKRRYVCKFSSPSGRNAIVEKSEHHSDDLFDYNIIGSVMSDADALMLTSAGRNAYDGIEKCEPDIILTSDDAEIGDAASSSTFGRRKLTSSQKALEQIGVMDGNRRIVSQGRHPVKICVADTGYALGHVGLPSKSTRVQGFDTTHRHNTQTTADDITYLWDLDRNGHGTHIAGIISARGNANENGMDVEGMGTFDIVVTRALNDNRAATSLIDVMMSIHQCLLADSDVINISLGCWACDSENPEHNSGCCPADQISIFREFLDKIAERALVVAAGGNVVTDGFEGGHYFPSSFSSVVSVGSINSRYEVAAFSNKNNQIEFVSPGSSIPSTDVTATGEWTYRQRSGTSMSAAYVSGAAAFLLSHNPTCSKSQVRNCLARSAKICRSLSGDFVSCDENTCDRNGDWGFGLIDVGAAISLLQQYGCSCGGEVLSYPVGTEGVCERYPDKTYKGAAHLSASQMLSPGNAVASPMTSQQQNPCVTLVETRFNHPECKYTADADDICPRQGGVQRRRKKISLSSSQVLSCSSRFGFNYNNRFTKHTAYARVDKTKVCRSDRLACGDAMAIKNIRCNRKGFVEIETYFYPDSQYAPPGSCRSAKRDGPTAEGYCYFRHRIRCDCEEKDLCRSRK